MHAECTRLFGRRLQIVTHPHPRTPSPARPQVTAPVFSRPSDPNETSAAWGAILHTARPAALILSRQNLPVLDRKVYAKASNLAKGGYVLADGGTDGKGAPDVILIGTGSEVALCLEARAALEASGIATRVVSMPCREWFDAQTAAYRAKVLPADVRARVSVEAGVAMGWRDLVGDAGETISIEHFGASADGKTLFREFGFTPEAVVAAAKKSLKANGSTPIKKAAGRRSAGK